MLRSQDGREVRRNTRVHNGRLRVWRQILSFEPRARGLAFLLPFVVIGTCPTVFCDYRKSSHVTLGVSGQFFQLHRNLPTMSKVARGLLLTASAVDTTSFDGTCYVLSGGDEFLEVPASLVIHTFVGLPWTCRRSSSRSYICCTSENVAKISNTISQLLNRWTPRDVPRMIIFYL